MYQAQNALCFGKFFAYRKVHLCLSAMEQSFVILQYIEYLPDSRKQFFPLESGTNSISTSFKNVSTAVVLKFVLLLPHLHLQKMKKMCYMCFLAIDLDCCFFFSICQRPLARSAAFTIEFMSQIGHNNAIVTMQ